MNIGDNILDSREIQERIDELEGLDEPDNEEKEELATLLAFREDVGSSEWEYGLTLILESYFTEYARDLAEDLGAMPDPDTWPGYCIDWEWAARELQHDYSSADIYGHTYYFQSC